MRETIADLWKTWGDAWVIPINGYVRRDGGLVMGRGVALQARKRWPLIEDIFGRKIKERTKVGKLGCILVEPGEIPLDGLRRTLVGFPVKHHWSDQTADIDLLAASARE